MSRKAISLSDLHDAISRLPNKTSDSGGRICRVAIWPPIGTAVPYNPDDPALEYTPPQYRTVDFEKRPALIDGVAVTAWFYHDVLVRVVV